MCFSPAIRCTTIFTASEVVHVNLNFIMLRLWLRATGVKFWDQKVKVQGHSVA